MSDAQNSDPVIVRPAIPADLSPIVKIYNHYIEHTHVTFDLTPFSVGERVPWFAQFNPEGPVQMLVAERSSTVLGFACSTPFKDRPGYAVSVETAVYMRDNETGVGTGRRLYETLLERLVGKGLHGAYGGVALPNDASLRLHEALGFRRVGEYQEVGFKFDRYWSVVWFEKRISS